MNENAILKDELKLIMPWSIAADVAAYLISLPFVGFGVAFPTGLLCGTLVMLVNFFVLWLSVRGSFRVSTQKAPPLMVVMYLVRFAIIGVVFYLTLQIEYVSTLAFIIPLFYPKIIYTVKALIKKE